MTWRVVPWVLLGATVACGSDVTTHVAVELDPLPPDHEVRVFASDLPTCAYREVGLIASDDLEMTLRAAREMGADGVIGTVLAQRGEASDAAICGSPDCVNFNTVAIRFSDPACRD